jgi:SagB-type dehydrogenase family enzyme
MDYGALFIAASSHVRAQTPDELDWDGRPHPSRTYPGAPRTPLAQGEVDAPLSAALRGRRSRREFGSGAFTQTGDLLHAAVGSPELRRHDGAWVHGRPFPSAGGLYPVELHVAAQDADGVPDGIHHYDSRAHALELRRPGRFQSALADATLDQHTVADARLVLALTGIATRTTWKYGARGWRYIWLEAGHMAQNLCLVAEALNLAALPVGGFYDAELAKLLQIPQDETPLYVIAVGV